MKIKVITVATRDTPELRALQRSAKRYGMDLTVLGLGEAWLGFGMKILLTKAYLQKLTGYTHFIFVDAYDTLFLKHIANVPDYILFSAEKNCWPRADLASHYPDAESAWKFLNSGCYSAPIDKWLELVNNNIILNNHDDQGYFTELFLNQKARNADIRLDTSCNLFQSYAYAAPGDFTINEELTNNITGTQPAIIHFNGKCHEQKIYTMVEYSILQEVAETWRDNADFAKELRDAFEAKVNADEKLNAHRTFVENNIFGFGERAFPWLWHLVIKELPKQFTFLEIGVFKGQTLSLVQLLANMQKKKCTRYGITPLSTEGGVWESDYKRDIEFIHDQFKLKKDYHLLVGLSEDPAIIEQASKLQLDVLYIDGGHETRHITNDIDNYAHLVKPGGFMVIDDCCNSFKMPFGFFQGIEAVTRVVDAKLPPATMSDEWKFLFSVVHNRVYKKVK